MNVSDCAKRVTDVQRSWLCRCAVLVFFAIIFQGCSLVNDTTRLPGKAVDSVTNIGKSQRNVDPFELQQQLMRFGDEYANRMVLTCEQLRRGTNTLSPIELQTWKLRYSANVVASVSGANTMANLLDLIVLVTLTRTTIQDYWMPKVYGESARPLLEVCQLAQGRIWRLAGPYINPKEQEELKKLIQEWYAKNPEPEQVFAIRAVGFASQLAADTMSSQEHQSTGVFHYLGMDVFSGLDPAARELAQTRLLAERAMFVAQRMPTLLRWQMELFSYELMATPEAKQALNNSERITRSVESFGRTADNLSKLVDEQRQAAIKQIFDGIANERTNLFVNLAAEESKLGGTLVELRKTLDSGTELSKSSDQLVRSLDKFLARYDKDTNAPPEVPNTNRPPFDILDYAKTAKDVTATIKELNVAINSLDNALPNVQKASGMLENSGNNLLNRFLLIGAALVVLLLVGIFLVLIGHRHFVARSISSSATKEPSETRIVG